MREIKFRAWTTKGMRDWDDLQAFHVHTLFKMATPEVQLMQYTGLRDKNGVEIYEGDILDWDKKEWGEPYTEVAAWSFELFDARKNDWPSWCEVIGNIHENPELLDQEIAFQ